MKRTISASDAHSLADRWSTLGLVIGLAFFLISGASAYWNIQNVNASEGAIRHTHAVLITLNDLLSATQDAETGQRGYLLTGNNRYLEPYSAAVTSTADRLKSVAELTQDNPVQLANVATLKRLIDAKMSELRETIDLRRTQGFEAALAVVETDRGKNAMDAIRAQLGAMGREELRLRQQRTDEMDAASRTAITGGIVTSLIGAVLTIAIFVLLLRNSRDRARQQWLDSGQVDLASAMMGDKSITELADAILAFLAEKTSSQAGALFKGEGGTFNRASTLGVPADADVPGAFKLNEGLMGKVAADGRLMVLNDVPAGYLTIGSALGRDTPRHLVIAPAKADGVVNAVIELGFFDPVDDRVAEFLEESSAPSASRFARRASDRCCRTRSRKPSGRRGTAGAERGAARLQRGTRGTGPRAQGIAGAARAAAGRAGADQHPARRAGSDAGDAARRARDAPAPRCSSRRGSWSRRASTSPTSWPT